MLTTTGRILVIVVGGAIGFGAGFGAARLISVDYAPAIGVAAGVAASLLAVQWFKL